MNESGECFPSQESIAKCLGIRRDTANQRIKSLLKFRFNGKPVVILLRKDGGWTKRNNVYRIEPASQIAIFKGEVANPELIESTDGNVLDKTNMSAGVDMLGNADNHMSNRSNTDMLANPNSDMLAKPDTNNNHSNNNYNNYIKKEQPSASPHSLTVDKETVISYGNRYDMAVDSDSGNTAVDPVDPVSPPPMAVKPSVILKRGREVKLGLEAEFASGELKNSGDVIDYFCRKYREHYSVVYTVNRGRDHKLVKDKLLANYTPGQIKAIIDIVFEHFDRKWANNKYPRPHIGALTTFLANEALAIIAAEEKKQAEIKKAMETPLPTAEELIARLRKGLD
jgi:hypothetical protein